MTEKINALLCRIWYKGKRYEIDIKGRDFYDLFCFYKKIVDSQFIKDFSKNYLSIIDKYL